MHPRTDHSLEALNGYASKLSAALKFPERQCLSRFPNCCLPEQNPAKGLINFNFLIAFILGIILAHFELLMIDASYYLLDYEQIGEPEALY